MIATGERLEAEFWAAQRQGDREALRHKATELVALSECGTSDAFHAAICVLLHHGALPLAKTATERAIAADRERCSANLLPLLAHVYQRMQDHRTAHLMFEECVQRDLLRGRNAFLAGTAAAVALTVAFQSKDEAAIVSATLRVVGAADACAPDTVHSAACALLARNEIAIGKQALEKALAADYEKYAPLLLPVLAHAHQRVYDFETAHSLFQICRRLGLLTGKNAFFQRTSGEVAHAIAELAMYRALCAGDLGDDQAETAGMVVARAYYESAFDDARQNAAKGAPGIIASAAPGPRMPDFIVAGSAKCGTTYLYDLLCNSASVWRRTPKEIHYFTSMHRFGDAFYSRFFELCPEGLLCGEASPDYLDNCCAPNPIDERIQRACPSAKVIVVVRDPALRAVSWYNQMTTNDTSRGGRPGRNTLNDLTMDQLLAYRNGNALRTGKFVEPLRRFVRTFGRDRLLILPFDDLLGVERLSTKVCGFLGIEPPEIGDARLRQNSGTHGRPSEGLYGQLREYYRASLDELEQEFGIRL